MRFISRGPLRAFRNPAAGIRARLPELLGERWLAARGVTSSVDEALTFGPKSAEDARFGDEDGVDGQAQLGSDGIGRNAFQGDALEGAPGAVRELGFDLLQQPLGDEAIVLLVPEPGDAAIGVSELVEQIGEIAVAGGQGGGRGGRAKSHAGSSR